MRNLILSVRIPKLSTKEVSSIQIYLIIIERRSKYFKIDDEKRRIIIFEVMIMNNPLKQVCQTHNINFSSAKNVIQIFKKEGRLEKKIQRARKSKNKLGSNSDPAIEDDDSDEEKFEDSGSQGQNKKGPICGLLLKLSEDDSFALVQRRNFTEQMKMELQALHSQNLTQSTYWISSSNNSSESSK